MSIEERIIVNFHPAETPLIGAPNGHRAELEPARFHGAAVVQLVRGDPQRADAVVVELHPADVTVTDERVAATDGEIAWSWLVGDLEAVIHGADDTWTIFVAPGISDFGVTVSPERVDEFRRVVDALPSLFFQTHAQQVLQKATKSEPAVFRRTTQRSFSRLKSEVLLTLSLHQLQHSGSKHLGHFLRHVVAHAGHHAV